ncbi:MAG TPA: hypothetical protein VF550_02050 [Polyangia bacterium]
MIPATWTDFAAPKPMPDERSPSVAREAPLASVWELVHACTVVAPLLSRIGNADTACSQPSTEAKPNAAAPDLRDKPNERDRGNLGRVVDAATPSPLRGTVRARTTAGQDDCTKDGQE